MAYTGLSEVICQFLQSPKGNLWESSNESTSEKIQDSLQEVSKTAEFFSLMFYIA